MVFGPLDFKIAARLENLPAISQFVAFALQRLGVKGDTFSVQLAVEEACTNIVQHAYAGKNGDHPISLRCLLSGSGDKLVVQIRDWGKPFDPQSVPPPDLLTEAEERKVGGLGMFIMRRMMDSVEYSFFAGRHNDLRMTKRLSAIANSMD